MQARLGTHGDHPIIALTPYSVQECYDLAIIAFNFAEEFRIPVILLMDEVIGHLREKVVLHKEFTIVDRKRPTLRPGDYIPYENNESMIPAMANFGDGYRYHVTGLTHNEKGLPTGNPEVTKKFMQRLTQKLNPYLERIQLVQEVQLDDAELIMVAYGCTARSALEAVLIARGIGLKVGLFRLITIWPFPQKQLEKYAARKYLVLELNNGQLVVEIERIFGYKAVERLNRLDGELITPEEILDRIREVVQNV